MSTIKTRAELTAEIEELKGRAISLVKECDHLRGMLNSTLDANEALLQDLSRIPNWVQWLFGVRW